MGAAVLPCTGSLVWGARGTSVTRWVLSLLQEQLSPPRPPSPPTPQPQDCYRLALERRLAELEEKGLVQILRGPDGDVAIEIVPVVIETTAAPVVTGEATATSTGTMGAGKWQPPAVSPVSPSCLGQVAQRRGGSVFGAQQRTLRQGVQGCAQGSPGGSGILAVALCPVVLTHPLLSVCRYSSSSSCPSTHCPTATPTTTPTPTSTPPAAAWG